MTIDRPVRSINPLYLSLFFAQYSACPDVSAQGFSAQKEDFSALNKNKLFSAEVQKAYIPFRASAHDQ